MEFITALLRILLSVLSFGKEMFSDNNIILGPFGGMLLRLVNFVILIVICVLLISIKADLIGHGV